MSGTWHPMPNLLARAASLLLGEAPDEADAPDVVMLLESLGYAGAAALAGSSAVAASEARQRGLLLRAASRFVRVFELGAPEAPGLVCVGAELDPAIADPLHVGSPVVSVSGVGLSLQEAFQGCIGEGIEYLSQLQTRGDRFEMAGPEDPAIQTWSAWTGFPGVVLNLLPAVQCRTLMDARKMP